MSPAQALAAILQNGPVESKAALLAMSERGFTAKQSRRARERLGIEVARAGFGQLMASTWRLAVGFANNAIAPATTTIRRKPTMLVNVGVQGGTNQMPTESTRAEPSVSTHSGLVVSLPASRAQVRSSVRTETSTDDAPLDDDDQRRIERRVTLFVERGMTEATADAAAKAIVIERDRSGSSGRARFSCVECQARSKCSVAKPFDVVHECWSCRHDAP